MSSCRYVILRYLSLIATFSGLLATTCANLAVIVLVRSETILLGYLLLSISVSISIDGKLEEQSRAHLGFGHQTNEWLR